MKSPSVDDFASTLKDEAVIEICASFPDTSYKVSRTLLTNASSWFSTALGERFMEGQTGKLYFKETEAKVIEYFLYWLYHGDTPFQNLSMDAGDDEEATSEQASLMIQLWIFGDKHFLPVLQNQAMDHLFNWLAVNFLKTEAFRKAYETAPPHSSLRRLLIDEVIAGLISETAEDSSWGYDEDDIEVLQTVDGFSIDLVQAFARHCSQISDWTRPTSGSYFVKEH